MATTKMIYENGKYYYQRSFTSFQDMVKDLPEEADFAVRDIPNCADGKVTIDSFGTLMFWVDKEGNSADWYEYNRNLKTWAKV